MNVLGIIAEYNPFHNGHLYHLQESKEAAGADAVVVVMSGNFTQRGEPAFSDKWTRAKAAACSGADLVIELPFVYACNNAEYFAKGAVSILDGLSCVNTVSFGSESGEMERLARVAELVAFESPAFKDILHDSMQRGLSYPKARANAVRIVGGVEASQILDEPNNILAVEYLKQLLLTGSKMTPLTIQRRGDSYLSETLSASFASALALRNSIASGVEPAALSHYMPSQSLACYQEMKMDVNKILNNYFLLLANQIFSQSEESLEQVFTAGEGLSRRLKKAVRKSENLEDLIGGIKSKRYTRTRVQRLLVHTLIGLKTSDFHHILQNESVYARLLAFSEKGATLLKQIRKDEFRISIITNINKQKRELSGSEQTISFDLLAADLYNLMAGNPLDGGSDYVQKPFFCKR